MNITTNLPFNIFLKINSLNLKSSEIPYCAFFDNNTEKYSNMGMRLVIKRLEGKGGLVICATNHLSEFAALKSAPAIYMKVLEQIEEIESARIDQIEERKSAGIDQIEERKTAGLDQIEERKSEGSAPPGRDKHLVIYFI